MDIPTSCMKCLQEYGCPNFRSMDAVPLPDDGLIKMICDRGHITYTVVQNDKFELLSQIAVQAIVDEYYREATVSFAASLERLYEFYLRVIWRSKSRSQDETNRLWKLIGGSSERQFGAFVGCYFSDHGEMPPVLNPDNVKFRNDVIHKGRFPSREDAVSFGQAALDIASPVCARLAQPEYEKALSGVIFDKIRRGHQLAGAGTRISTCGLATPFSVTTQTAKPTMTELVEAQTKMPNLRKFKIEAAKLVEQMMRASQGSTAQAFVSPESA